MALDLYAGGFSRYYAREWENVVQAQARLDGINYNVIRLPDDPGPTDWDEATACVNAWRAEMLQGLGQHAPAELDWDESRNAPYHTDRPNWDGYAALVLLAACTACKEPLPAQLPQDALASEVVLRTHDPAIRPGYRSITKAQLWVPALFTFTFDFPDLTDEKSHIASVACLIEDLASLMAIHQITEADLAASLRDGYADGAPFMPIARFGLAIFLSVARKAHKDRLPMCLNF